MKDIDYESIHDCALSHGKIVAIMIKDGKTYCGYCKQQVDYPNMTKEELEECIKKATSSE